MIGDQRRRFPSPLRYPGGKGKVANYMKLLFLENSLLGSHYVELYAGGASVALSLLYDDFASHIHINDINRSVHAFWRATLEQTDELCQRIRDTPVTIEEWQHQKSVQATEDPDPLDLAFSTFFLNRTNRSGIIDGGVIGGQEQTGAWKIDARYNVPNLIRRIEKVGRHSSRITLTQRDAAEYIREVEPTLPERTLLYLDPPYYTKGDDLYENSYTHSDHVEMAELARQLQHQWVISYDAADEILALYEGVEGFVYSLSYSAGDRYRGKEAMYFSPALTPPAVQSPANIPSKAVANALLQTCFG